MLYLEKKLITPEGKGKKLTQKELSNYLHQTKVANFGNFAVTVILDNTSAPTPSIVTIERGQCFMYLSNTRLEDIQVYDMNGSVLLSHSIRFNNEDIWEYDSPSGSWNIILNNEDMWEDYVSTSMFGNNEDMWED